MGQPCWLLHDDGVKLGDRAAGLLVLRYTQRPAAISRLTVNHVQAHGDGTCLLLGREPVVLPEPLASLALELVATRGGCATIGDRGTSPWLFPGGWHGQPISPYRLAERLDQVGIHPGSARSTALFLLAAELPAAIFDRAARHPHQRRRRLATRLRQPDDLRRQRRPMARPTGRPGPDMSIRLIILVSGAPAAGKTTLAAGLADALELPLISKDDVKETLVDALGGPAGDLAWSRRIGGAAMELLWRLAGRCPAAVLEANFRPRSQDEQSRLPQLRARVIEVRCLCPPDELARRFSARAKTAHPAHPLTQLTANCSPRTTGP